MSILFDAESKEMNIEELVNQNYEWFSESDCAVCRYISAHREKCAGMFIIAETLSLKYAAYQAGGAV